MADSPPSFSPATFELSGSVASILVDGVEQSRVDLDRPGRLEFEYMQQMDTVVDLAMPAPAPVRAAHVGACGCALAWAWNEQRPGSKQLAIEIDPNLTRQVREWLPLPRKPQLRIRVGDGRDVIEGSKASFDILVRDAFAVRDVPESLRTVEWNQAARERLGNSGVYLANTGHGGGTDSRPDIAATLEVFPRVALVGESKVLKGARWGNLVIVAWTDPGIIDTQELDRRLRRLALPVSVYAGARLKKWLGGSVAARDPEVI